METLQYRVLTQATKMLDNLGVKYKIIDQDGVTYKNFDDTPPKPAKRPKKYPYGKLREHVRLFCEDAVFKPGTTVIVPCCEFDPIDIQSSIGSYASAKFGKSSIKTTMDRVNNTVTAYRAF